MSSYTYSTGSNPYYYGLYHDSTNDFIYVAAAASALQAIHVFNLNLALTDTISVTPYNPFSINKYNNQL